MAEVSPHVKRLTLEKNSTEALPGIQHGVCRVDGVIKIDNMFAVIELRNLLDAANRHVKQVVEDLVYLCLTLCFILKLDQTGTFPECFAIPSRNAVSPPVRTSWER